MKEEYCYGGNKKEKLEQIGRKKIQERHQDNQKQFWGAMKSNEEHKKDKSVSNQTDLECERGNSKGRQRNYGNLEKICPGIPHENIKQEILTKQHE